MKIEVEAPLLAKPAETKKNNTAKGIFFWCLSGSIFCLNFLCGKLLFNNHGDMDSQQLMVYRSTASIALLVIWHNRNLPEIMYYSVQSDCVKPLVTRVVTGNFAIYVNFMSLKYFPLTLVAMVVNCAPFVQLLLAGPILGERISLGDVISTLITFSCIALVLLGA